MKQYCEKNSIQQENDQDHLVGDRCIASMENMEIEIAPPSKMMMAETGRRGISISITNHTEPIRTIWQRTSPQRNASSQEGQHQPVLSGNGGITDLIWGSSMEHLM